MDNLKRDISKESWRAGEVIEGKIEVFNEADMSRICTIRVSDFLDEKEAVRIAYAISKLPNFISGTELYLFSC